MGSSLIDSAASRHRILSEITHPAMAKADLKKVEADFRKQVGECICRARKTLNWSLKELAEAIKQATGKEPDPAQLSRWEAGTERPHFDALFAVEKLQGPLVIALASLAAGVAVDTVIHIRRTA